MLLSRMIAFLAVMSLPLVGIAANTLPLPERGQTILHPATVAELQKEVGALNEFVGSYPPNIKSESEREDVYKRWSFLLEGAWEIEAKEPSSESTLALLADIYRQGHNLDVQDTGARAMQTVERCLAEYPNSVRCHFTAAYIYLSANKWFAPKGEASLIRLRELLKPEVNLEVERGFVFAYLYQGKNDQALKQVEYFLTLDPGAEWAKQFRSALLNDRVDVHSE